MVACRAPLRAILLATAFIAAAASTALAEPQTTAVTVKHTDLPAVAYRDVHVDGTSRDNTVALEPFEYIVHGDGYRIEKTGFGDQHKGRYTFTLGRGTAKAADIYKYQGGGTATVNGHAVTFESVGYGAWTVATVPGKVLREGTNAIIFDSGGMGMDLDAVPAKRSAVSNDGGKTWAPANGEFYVNIRLHRYPARGAVTSPVFDLGSPNDEPIVRPTVELRHIAVDVDADTPKGTSIRVEVRRGSRWNFRAEGWSDWQTIDDLNTTIADAAKTGRRDGRQLLQWRATLQSSDSKVTPVLRSVTVKAAVETIHASSGVRVVSVDQPDIVRSSYAFTWQEPSPRLELLRNKYKLDEVIAPGKTHFDKLVLLRNWVRRQWPHNDMGSGIRTWDALEILGAPDNKHGMCVHFGVAFTQCALAVGYNARQVILNGHYVSEAWSPEHRKWVMMDVETTNGEGWNRHGSAHYVDADTGEPLSALELHLRIREGKASSIVQKLAMTNDAGVHETFDRTYKAEDLGFMTRFAYPLRNNYLDQLEPWEEFHGQDHYRCSAYLWWANDLAGNTPEYPVQTTRPADIVWTTNGLRARVYASGEPGRVIVKLEHDMPNYLASRVQSDQPREADGKKPLDSLAPVDKLFLPAIAPGKTHTYTITPINRFHITGRTTTLKLSRDASPRQQQLITHARPEWRCTLDHHAPYRPAARTLARPDRGSRRGRRNLAAADQGRQRPRHTHRHLGRLSHCARAREEHGRKTGRRAVRGRQDRAHLTPRPPSHAAQPGAQRHGLVGVGRHHRRRRRQGLRRHGRSRRRPRRQELLLHLRMGSRHAEARAGGRRQQGGQAQAGRPHMVEGAREDRGRHRRHDLLHLYAQRRRTGRRVQVDRQRPGWAVVPLQPEDRQDRHHRFVPRHGYAHHPP